MGCSVSAEPLAKIRPEEKMMDDTHDNNMISEREKLLIRRTWRIISNNMPGLGASIFLKIFAIKPSVKQIFPFRDITGDELIRNHHFRGHASRFMQAIGAAVDNIDALDKTMVPLLNRLGRQHVNYAGFNVDDFDTFVSAIIQVLGKELGTKFTNDVSTAWRHLAEYIIFSLKKGYHDAKLKA